MYNRITGSPVAQAGTPKFFTRQGNNRVKEGGGGGTLRESSPPLRLRGEDSGSSSDEGDFKMNNIEEEYKLVTSSNTPKVAAHFQSSSD